MSDQTNIEWCDATWNPVRGCSLVSAGCTNCYAMHVAARFNGAGLPYEGLTVKTSQGPKWSGKIMLVPEALHQPGRWTRPRKIFVNSMSDLFHDGVPDDYIDAVFAVMAQNPRHIFQVLTKRPERMRDYMQNPMRLENIYTQWYGTSGSPREAEAWPLPNVWLGVSIEDQPTANSRLPVLLQTPAAIRWLSMEPLLGQVDLTRWINPVSQVFGTLSQPAGAISWVVVGGESGTNARPMHPDWARSLRDQCAAAGVPFLFKQWGEWAPHRAVAGGDEGGDLRRGHVRYLQGDGREPDGHFRRGDAAVARVGKKAAGRLLDGVEWNGYPEVRP